MTCASVGLLFAETLLYREAQRDAGPGELPVRVRHLRSRDYQAFVQLLRSSATGASMESFELSPERFRLLFVRRSAPGFGFVAEDFHRRVVGIVWGGLFMSSELGLIPKTHLFGPVVAKGFSGKGIERRLTEAAVRITAQAG